MDHLTDWTIGIDLGDKKSTVFAINRSSGEVAESEFEMTPAALRTHFEDTPRCRVVFETGGHSRWVKRVLSSMEFEVVVADPRRLALITKSSRKNDRNDAMRLAELGAVDLASSRLELRNPVEHRDDLLQADLAVLHSRDTLVSMRTRLINTIRGVGALTAMAFRLVLADAKRFKRSRDAASYVGLCPKQHESESLRKGFGITKTGDRFLRRLLVHSAHYILGPFGEDCDLRRWGERRHSRGGKAAKKRAVAAVARKLAVVLHRPWADQSEYEPLWENAKQAA